MRVTLARADGSAIVAGGVEDGTSTVEVPIEHAGQRIGMIALGPRRGARAYQRLELETLRRTADIIGNVIGEPAV